MDGCNGYMNVMTLIRITEDHDPWCSHVMIPSSGLCTLAFGETQRGKVRRTSCLPKSPPSHQYHHHYPLFSTFIIPIHTREDTVIDLDGPGPLPPFSVTCYKSSTGFTTAVRSERTNIKSIWQRRWTWWCRWWQLLLLRHDNEEMTKVDGFQEPGSFRQVIVIVNPFFFLWNVKTDRKSTNMTLSP